MLATLWRQQSWNWKDSEGRERDWKWDSEERLKMVARRFENTEDGEKIYEFKKRKASERKTQGTQ